MCSRVVGKTCGSARLTLVSLVFVVRTFHLFCVHHSSTDAYKTTSPLTSGVSLSVHTVMCCDFITSKRVGHLFLKCWYVKMTCDPVVELWRGNECQNFILKSQNSWNLKLFFENNSLTLCSPSFASPGLSVVRASTLRPSVLFFWVACCAMGPSL